MPARAVLCVLALLVGLPLGARAASHPYQLTLTIDVGTLLARPYTTGALLGAGTAHVSPAGTFFVPAGGIDGNVTVPITPPSGGITAGIALDASNLAGTLGPTGGTLPLRGLLRLCVLMPCAAGSPSLNFPLDRVGASGTTAMNFGAIGFQTVRGAPWQLTANILGSGLTTRGFAHGPASSTSTAIAPGGSLQLVSPLVFSPGIGAGPTPYVHVAKLTFTFVPEPGAAALLGVGIAALGALGRRLSRTC